MSRPDLRFLGSAFEMSLDRGRLTAQFTGAAAGLGALWLASGIADAAGSGEAAGRLLGLPFLYACLMVSSTVVCASCRHARNRPGNEGREAFDALDALGRNLFTAASGSAVFVLAAGVAGLLAGLVLLLGKTHPWALSAVSVLLVPLSLLLAAALAALAAGLFLFPPLAALSGGDLEGLGDQLMRILRQRALPVLGQCAAALALSLMLTGLVAAALWGGWRLAWGLADGLFPGDLLPRLLGGATGLLHRLECLLVLAAAAAPGLSFLSSASYLIVSAPPGEPVPVPGAAGDDEDEESWLLP